jgi:hypothetical protein
MLYVLAESFETGALDGAVKDLPDEGMPFRNAAVDSFLLHARQLIEFFTGRYDRDLAADHFTRGGWMPPTDLRDLHLRISKAIHLSGWRARSTEDQRRIFFRAIVDTLTPEVRRFLEAADPDRLCPGFVDDVQAALGDSRPSPMAEVRISPTGTTAGTATPRR